MCDRRDYVLSKEYNIYKCGEHPGRRSMTYMFSLMFSDFLEKDGLTYLWPNKKLFMFYLSPTHPGK